MIAVAHAVQDVQEDILVVRDDLATCATKLLTDAGRFDAATAKKCGQQSFRADKPAEELLCSRFKKCRLPANGITSHWSTIT